MFEKVGVPLGIVENMIPMFVKNVHIESVLRRWRRAPTEAGVKLLGELPLKNKLEKRWIKVHQLFHQIQ